MKTGGINNSFEDKDIDKKEESPEETIDKEWENTKDILEGILGLVFIGSLIYFPFFAKNNKQIILDNSYLFAFLINSFICFLSSTEPLRFSYFLFDYKFDGVSNNRILSFAYFVGGVFYIEFVLEILLKFNLSTFFQDLLISSGCIVALKLLLDSLVGITRRFERKK
tara:strand:- start:515 stop:1015 length:501 start_codon:yes stop_codon:yes gene_type:complete